MADILSVKVDTDKVLLKEYQEFCKKAWSSTVQNNQLYFAVGLAGEVGEVCEEVKKAYRDDRDFDKEKLTNELGDVLWYLTNIASKAGITLEEVMQQNIKKLTKRHGDSYKSCSSDTEKKLRVVDVDTNHEFRWNGPRIQELDESGKHIRFVSKNKCPKHILEMLEKLKEQEESPPW